MPGRDFSEYPDGFFSPMGIMKRRLILLAAACSLIVICGTSCTTMYDSAGRPVDVITPEGAALAVVAAGVVGYAIADDGHDNRHHRAHGHARRPAHCRHGHDRCRHCH